MCKKGPDGPYASEILELAYQEMAADRRRELEADDWSENLLPELII